MEAGSGMQGWGCTMLGVSVDLVGWWISGLVDWWKNAGPVNRKLYRTKLCQSSVHAHKHFDKVFFRLQRRLPLELCQSIVMLLKL